MDPDVCSVTCGSGEFIVKCGTIKMIVKLTSDKLSLSNVILYTIIVYIFHNFVGIVNTSFRQSLLSQDTPSHILNAGIVDYIYTCERFGEGVEIIDIDDVPLSIVPQIMRQRECNPKDAMGDSIHW